MKNTVKNILKNTVAFLLMSATIFTLFIFTSCSNDVTENINLSNSPDNANSTNGDAHEPKETEPEPFEMQEPTNKLTLYTIGMTGITINPAVNIFKEMYPDVEVEVKSFSGRNTEPFC